MPPKSLSTWTVNETSPFAEVNDTCVGDVIFDGNVSGNMANGRWLVTNDPNANTQGHLQNPDNISAWFGHDGTLSFVVRVDGIVVIRYNRGEVAGLTGNLRRDNVDCTATVGVGSSVSDSTVVHTYSNDPNNCYRYDDQGNHCDGAICCMTLDIRTARFPVTAGQTVALRENGVCAIRVHNILIEHEEN